VKTRKVLRIGICLFGLTFAAGNLPANIPGGGSGTGPNVTLVDNGDGTVTMANGIVTIVCITSSAVLSQINYTYNNSGTTVTNQLLNGGKDGGEFYWENGGFGSGAFAYSVIADPGATGGNYAEIDLLSTSTTNGVMDVHFSMLRGSPGFYVTGIWQHRDGDVAMGTGEERDNIYLNPEFTWNSIDATRNFQYDIGGSAVGVFGAPVEVTLWTNGIDQGKYEDKYKYSADFGTERVWGWSSVSNTAAGFVGQNIGIWHVLASVEFYNGGPMKPELMDAPMVNMINGGHYYMGGDSGFGANEVWTRVSGPYFIYCNSVTNTLTDPTLTANALFADAQAQAQAEASAWPYSWFTNADYAPASNRGTVTGQFVINDSGNPNASAANLWVGVVQQPITTDSVYDFQQWMKPYQFWVKTDTNGNFTIPNVIAGANYTLYAFGPGAAGTFMSQSQTGGNPPLLYNLPAVPFGVTVTGGATNNLATVTWTPSRVGPTIFEIGYPDRTARKFRHGDDWWVGDMGPSPTKPSPIWSKFLEYPFDFPSGPNYIVGQSRWSTDWNFCQPIVTDSSGNYNGSTSTITFNLASAPASGAQASLYLAIASDYHGPLIVSVNGSNLGSTAGVTASPSAEGSGGFTPTSNISDTTVREGINAAFSDERLTFPGSLLRSGQNTITLNMPNGGYFANHAMYDYIRLELTGYVPPPPASVAAYAGNNCNLICWPVTPGATSYNVLRSTTSGSGYTSITNGVIGPVCGSGTNNATYLDTNAVNGTTYYYVVQSVNPVSASANSPESPGVTPNLGISTSAPPAPTGLTVTTSGHQSVTLTWNASSGANYYTIQRSALVANGGGASDTLSTITLSNNITGTTYTDTSPTDGSIYSYSVTASSAGGTSANSASAVGVPLPSSPASAPGSLTANVVQSTNITLTWSAVSGAVGYIIQRGTSASGPFTYVMSITETTYTDTGLNPNTTYYYEVAAVNAAGTSANSTVSLVMPPPVPASLGATPGNSQIVLNWAASTGATSYIIKRGLSSGSETTLVTGVTGTSYTDSGLVNGTTYYYVVAAVGSSGTSGNSPEAHATPSIAAAPALVWKSGTSTSWDTTTINWLNGATAAAYADGDTVTFNDSAVSSSVVTASGVYPGSVTFANGTLNYTVTGGGTGISGATSLVKTNGGSLTLSGTHSYTGGTFVNGGNLVFSVGSAIPATGTVTLNNTGAVTVTTANSLPNVMVNGTNTITGYGNSGTGIATLNDAGTLTLAISGGSKVFDLTGTMTGSGILVLGSPAMTLRFNGTAGDGNAIFNLGTGNNFASVRNAPFAIALGGLTGGSSTVLEGASSAASAVTFTIGGANTSTEFDGVIANGSYAGNPAVSVIKTGVGALILTGANNTYSGGTTINGGVLLANNTTGSATGSGAVTVANGGTLGGTGAISGAVTVKSGGTLVPGNPLGTLTISNNLTLATGSTTMVQVQHSPLTNDSVLTSGTLSEGGTLVVSNAGVAAFATGDHFKLFSAAGFSGAFAGFVLPTLNAGLVWNTNTLNLSGTLSVAAYLPPTIGALTVGGGNLNFSGSGGIPYWTYYVLTSTNLNLALAQWSPIATNQFDAGGNFALTFINAVNPGSPQMFYTLQLQ
jgi:autotransporter-associated beta strand protein